MSERRRGGEEGKSDRRCRCCCTVAFIVGIIIIDLQYVEGLCALTCTSGDSSPALNWDSGSCGSLGRRGQQPLGTPPRDGAGSTRRSAPERHTSGTPYSVSKKDRKKQRGREMQSERGGGGMCVWGEGGGVM